MATELTFNKLCDSGRLEKELHESSLVTVERDHIWTSNSPETTKIYFKADVPPEQETAVANIVTAHVNIPLPDGQRDEYGNPVVALNIPTTTDKRPNFHDTSRPLGTYTYFTGAGDDTSDPTLVGGDAGTSFAGHHQVNDAMTEVHYADFNSIKNETWLHEGAMQWLGARNDELTFEVVPTVTASSVGENTNFNLYGGYLIIPAAGDGTLAVNASDMKLVQCVPNEFGAMPGGYWDATFNNTTKEFENITPNYSGLGGYNLFAAEVSLNRFGNRLLILGDGHLLKGSKDTTQVGHGFRVRLTAKTLGTDHEWWWNLHLGLFRKRTV